MSEIENYSEDDHDIARLESDGVAIYAPRVAHVGEGVINAAILGIQTPDTEYDVALAVLEDDGGPVL